ncbi:MAG: hypothetical protein Q8K70_08240 [Bacteroidota bacterium]|nr:hypothetical protein [Bacteroidota bacterium]
MKHKAILIISLLLNFPLFSQTNITKIDSIKIINGSSISHDGLGNLYVITPTNDIIKYDFKGKLIATVNNKVLGNISWIDASNPFEIYVFFRDQNKLLLLDNLLNQLSIIDFESIGISQIACISRSFDNQIWLFDMADFKLKKYSKDLKLILESAPFNLLPNFKQINPTQISDFNSGLYILNKNQIFEFDIFGNYNKMVFSDTLISFQKYEHMIAFTKNNQLLLFDTQNFKISSIPLATPNLVKDIRIVKNRIYILTDEYVILQPLQ